MLEERETASRAEAQSAQRRAAIRLLGKPKEEFGDLRILARGNLTAEARGVEGTGQGQTTSESDDDVLSELCVSERDRGEHRLVQRMPEFLDANSVRGVRPR